MMKNDHSLQFFIEHARKITEYYKLKEDEDEDEDEGEISDEEETNKSYVRPKLIVAMYHNNKLDDYIQVCIKEERSPLFIDKIRELKTMTLNEVDVRKYIKNILKSHTNASAIEVRTRVSQKELFGFLKLKNIDKCIETYARVHGEPEGFRNDIGELLKNWNEDTAEANLRRVIIKYQNKRNS